MMQVLMGEHKKNLNQQKYLKYFYASFVKFSCKSDDINFMHFW